MLHAVNKDQLEKAVTLFQPFARAFVEALTGGFPDTLLHWRLIAEHPDIPLTDKGRRQVKNKRGAITNPLCMSWLTNWSLQGWAVFVTVNEYPQESLSAAKGYFTEDRVVRARAAVADVDIEKGNAPPGWQHGDVAGSSASWDPSWPLPTMQVESAGGPHFWWLYTPGQEPSATLGKGINHSFQALLHSDPQICDMARVLRVPPFLHWKTGEPQPVRLVFADKNRTYSGAELETVLTNLGHKPGAAEIKARPNTSVPDGGVAEIEMTKEEYRRAFQEATRFVMEQPVCQPGSRGSTLIKKICPRLHDFGLNTEDALKLLKVWAAQRCSQEPSADGEWPATEQMLLDRWERSSTARDQERGSEVEGWRSVVSLVDDIQHRQGETKEKPHKEAEPEPDFETVSGEVVEDEEDKEPPPDVAGPDGPKPPDPDDKDRRVWICIRSEHRKTIEEINNVIRQDPRLFEHRGELSHVVNTSHGPIINPLTRNSLTTYVTDLCRFFSWQEKDGEWIKKPAHSSVYTWLWAEMIDQKSWTGVRPLKALARMPRIKEDGSIIHQGYSSDDQFYYIPDQELKELQVGETQEQAAAALTFLVDLISDFPLVGDTQRAAAVAAMLTPFCRKAQKGPAPMFLIDGNKPDIGKSNLLKVITCMFDESVYTTTWASLEHSEENKKNITSAFQENKSIIALDNLSGSLGDSTLDSLLTASTWAGRLLGKNQIVNFENLLTVIGTANNLQVKSDLWRRVIPIRLVDNGEESRTDFKYDLSQHLPKVKKQMVEACLTILRAFCIAGRPGGAKKLGSFENWSRWVPSALMWLGMPDVVSLVESSKEALEDSKLLVEREAVLDAVETVQADLKKPDGITAQDLADELEKARTADSYEAITKRFAILVGILTKYLGLQQPISRSDVGTLFKKHRDNSVKDRALIMKPDKGKRKPTLWKIVKLAPGTGIPLEGPEDSQ